MTIKQKLENYWYHYKWHTILGVFIAFTLVVGITQCSTVQPYDQNCVLYCNRVVHDNGVLALEQELTKRIGDHDKNGKTMFEVTNVSYNNAQNTAISNSQKLLQLASSSDYILYVVDEHGYEYLMGNGMFRTCEFFPDKDHTAWNWNGSVLQQALKEYNLPKDLYFCIRVIESVEQQQDPQVQQRVSQAEQLIKKLMAEGLAPTEETPTQP